MFSIMIVKHHNVNPIRVQKKRSTRKENRCFHQFVTVDTSTKYRALYFPGFRGLESRKISEFFQAPVEPAIMDNCNFPPGTQCGFLGFSGRAEKGHFRQKKKGSFHAVFGAKKWDLLSISQFPKSLSRKIHLLKAPQRGPVDGNPEKGGFRGSPQDLPASGISQHPEITQFYRNSIKSITIIYNCISQHSMLCKYL